MTQRPMCKSCHTRHFSYEPHNFEEDKINIEEKRTVEPSIIKKIEEIKIRGHRKKIYTSNAEKQKAYRERKRKKK